MDSRKQTAVDFINSIRTMDPKELNALILREAGEDLAQFFLMYSSNLIVKDPGRVLENTCSLMLMGYLIGRRAGVVDGGDFLRLATQPKAEA